MTGTRPAEILRQLESAEPDAELLARFVATKNPVAFAELVRRHGPLVLGVCRRVTGHSQDAEDAFQAAFLVLAKKAGSLRHAALLGNWLYGVAYRVASKAKRSAARRRTREVTVSTLPDPPAPSPAPAMPELMVILDEELAALAECYREAIVLCDLRGVSREDAAAALGIPEGTLSSRLANGRKKLAARLTKRGVALSVATIPTAVADAAAAPAVPNELLTKTCGLVADWSAGGAVPVSLARLAEGGFAMRKTLLLGAMMCVAVAGAVLAARPKDDPPVVDPPKQPLLAEKLDAPQPKEQPKPADKPAVAYTDAPRLRAATDINIRSVSTAAWSGDGRFFAVQGFFSEVTKDGPRDSVTMILLAIDKDVFTRLYSAGVKLRGELVGFSPDSRELITEKREYSLVSGFHWLRFEGTPENIEKTLKDGYRPTERKVTLDLPETHGYSFAPDGKTYRTVAWHREATGAVKTLEVLEVSTATGKVGKSLLKVEQGQQSVLAPNGKRLAVLDKEIAKVTVYDLDRGAKQFEYALGGEKFADLPPLAPQGIGGQFSGPLGSGQFGGAQALPQNTPLMVFSPDARRLVVSRAIGQTVVLNAETGEAMAALDGAKEARLRPDAHAFSGDGRLLAMPGTSYKLVKRRPDRPGGFKGAEQNMWETGSSFLTVWDTETGKAVKTWNRSPSVMFSQSKPMLAILENNGDTIRVGFWDFSAEVEKK